ncbi:MAG TPA: MerR family transcriptional regulator [Candidatus Limnocylindrales bacterium]|nr:MerR family transcriptional regulator [Candidatus Limnocylindrales bacterium]
MPDDDRYSLTELADLAGVTPRTVRYYLAQGLLPAVGQTGPGSKYGAQHLDRLRLIKRLQAEHLPLAEIRHRLAGLDPDAIRDLAVSPAPPPAPDSALEYLRTVLGGPRQPAGPRSQASAQPIAAEPAPVDHRLALAASAGAIAASAPPAMPAPPPPATSLERSQWERIALAPDVELHIRRPLTRSQNKQIDRLVTIARELLEEERP